MILIILGLFLICLGLFVISKITSGGSHWIVASYPQQIVIKEAPVIIASMNLHDIAPLVQSSRLRVVVYTVLYCFKKKIQSWIYNFKNKINIVVNSESSSTIHIRQKEKIIQQFDSIYNLTTIRLIV